MRSPLGIVCVLVSLAVTGCLGEPKCASNAECEPTQFCDPSSYRCASLDAGTPVSGSSSGGASSSSSLGSSSMGTSSSRVSSSSSDVSSSVQSSSAAPSSSEEVSSSSEMESSSSMRRDCALELLVDGAPVPDMFELDEVGPSRSVTLRLTSAPTDTVDVVLTTFAGNVIGFGERDAAITPVYTQGFTFTPSNWSTPVGFDIFAWNDTERSAPRGFNITFTMSSGDECFNLTTGSAGTLNGTVVDNDRYIFVTNRMISATLLSGVESADDLCRAHATQFMSEFGSPGLRDVKAVIVDGQTRVARSDAGSVDWVLHPFASYRSLDFLSFTTNAEGIYDFTRAPLSSPVNSGAPRYWTGLNPDWTTSASTCNAWMSATSSNLGAVGYANLLDAGAISITDLTCDQAAQILCAEQ